MNFEIVSLGDQALILQFGDRIAPAGVRRIQACCQILAAASLPGLVELVPAATSLTLFYSAAELAAAGAPDSALVPWLSARVREHLADVPEIECPASPRSFVIPVCYGGEFGPDLDAVATRVNLSCADVIALHSRAEYIVLQLGFAPGFPYLLGLPEALAVPRRDSPRIAVPPGSVGIANDQSCIYPLAIPGGWNLIGRTPWSLFQPGNSPPVLLQPGDLVRFRPIAANEFAALQS